MIVDTPTQEALCDYGKRETRFVSNLKEAQFQQTLAKATMEFQKWTMTFLSGVLVVLIGVGIARLESVMQTQTEAQVKQAELLSKMEQIIRDMAKLETVIVSRAEIQLMIQSAVRRSGDLGITVDTDGPIR